MRTTIIVLSLLFLTNCKDDDTINNCNFLLNVGVNVTLNLNLPEYSSLNFTGNVVYINANQGNKGIYVINAGTTYRAWDAADPNHVQSSCSFLEREGVNVTCGCADENEYDLFTGNAVGQQLPCQLKEYRVTVSGNNLVISN